MVCTPLLSLPPSSVQLHFYVSLLEDKAWLVEDLDLPVVSTLPGWDCSPLTFLPAPLSSTLVPFTLCFNE